MTTRATAEAILAMLGAVGGSHSNDIAAHFGVSVYTVIKKLALMRAQGLVHPAPPKSRHTRWFLESQRDLSAAYVEQTLAAQAERRRATNVRAKRAMLGRRRELEGRVPRPRKEPETMPDNPIRAIRPATAPLPFKVVAVSSVFMLGAT